MKLRPYQQVAQDRILEAWDRGEDKTLLVLPTGTGKTIVFTKLTERLILDRKATRVLILAHREELILQAADKLQQATGLPCDIEKADLTALNGFSCITAGSIQSLTRPDRLAKFAPDYYSHIIVDEAHHVLSDSYMRVLDHFGGAKVLGVTATPDRGDKKNLGQYFDSLAFEYTLPQAIKEGFLSPIKAQTLPLDIDLTKVATTAGDFQLGGLDDALAPYLGAIVEQMKKYCMDRKTIVFLPLIATSQRMQELLNAAGFRAGEVNGESKDRKQILEDFHNDKYNVLCNSMLLTEGYDEPGVDCIVPLRPTKIRSLYCQIVGRGTRLSPETGKEDLLVLDFLWHTDKHQLCRPANLICENEEVAAKMTENLEDLAREGGGPVDIEEAEQQAEGDAVAEREEALAAKLKEMRKRKARLVDPVQFNFSINAEDLVDYTPAFGWEMAPPSKGQLDRLEKAGICPDTVENAGYASKLIDRIDQRKTLNLATPKQVRMLEKYGYEKVGLMDFPAAQNLIGRIAANKWRKVPLKTTPAPSENFVLDFN